MGNSIGANLSVQLNQDNEVCSGSTLSGTIYLDIEKDSVAADSLNIKFYGQERSQVVVSNGQAVATYTDKHRFISLDYVLHNFNGEVNRGRYEYPFEIILPVGLPGKQGIKSPQTLFSTKDQNWFVIEYFLEARLHRNGMLEWDAKNNQEILLSDPPYYNTKIPSFIEPISLPVFFGCCYKTGTMTLLANVDSKNVFINDTFQVEYAVRNESTSTVEKIEINVREIHHFRARCRDYIKSTIIHKQQIKGGSGSANFHISDSSIDSLRKAVKVCTAKIPNVRPSYNGRLGDVWYVVEVQAFTSLGTQNPLVTIPMTVLRNRVNFAGVIPAVETAFALPDDWKATKAKMAELYEPIAEPIASAHSTLPPPPVDAQSLNALIYDTRQSNQWTETTVLKNWIKNGNIDEFTHQNMGYVFKCISGEYSYTAFPEIIGEAMVGKLTCKHISGAAMAVPEAYKAAVCYNFARYCIDKHNAQVEFQCVDMPPYALSLLLMSYV
jgi:hypothetical protein